MLDGEGRARITDFGLAGVAEAIRGDDVRSGTPAYMSPEQLEGREVTTRSDLFSLGLLLYELVTGRRLYDGKTLAEVMRQRQEAPRRPSEGVPDLDPRVEAVILRCLERDPGRRPPSALAVLAALPGGDALSSLLTDGHTPSPEMLAAAGDAEERLTSVRAWAALAVVLAGTVLVPAAAAPLQLTSLVPFEKSPVVLEDRARELARELGPSDPPADEATGFAVDADFVQHLRSAGRSAASERLETGAPPVLHFWYRRSPQLLVSRSPSGRVFWNNPPQAV
jgi:serine/threonine-protein kinase